MFNYYIERLRCKYTQHYPTDLIQLTVNSNQESAKPGTKGSYDISQKCRDHLVIC